MIKSNIEPSKLYCMSSIRLSPLRAVQTYSVNAWNGITTPESRIRWGVLRFIASRCKDETGIDAASEPWKQHMASNKGQNHNYHAFLGATWDLIYRYVVEVLSVEQRQLLSSMTKFPFGIHRCYADADVLCPGYVSNHGNWSRFLNLTGWMHFVNPKFTPDDLSNVASLQDCRLETLLGLDLGCSAHNVLDGMNGLKGSQNTKIQVLVLTGLVYDRLLEKPLYQGALSLYFGNPPE